MRESPLTLFVLCIIASKLSDGWDGALWAFAAWCWFFLFVVMEFNEWRGNR